MNRAAKFQNKVYEAVLESETDFAGWRASVRDAIAADIAPANLYWKIAGRNETLDLEERSALSRALVEPRIAINKSFLSQLKTALLHNDRGRFDLAYKLVYRSQFEKNCYLNPADGDVKRLRELASAVRRDIHKMHAFVRFRKTGVKDGREQFVAWFEPEHHITSAVAPFFRNRFTGMDWLIVTPEMSISWDGENITYGPGGDKKDAPSEDAVVEEWQTYYANIFNPARLKLDAMRSEMPLKYWKNLPEARIIPSLVKASGKRTNDMITRRRGGLSFKPDSPESGALNPRTLDELYRMLAAQNDWPIENFSSKLIKGEGPSNAAIMFIGEQPGDTEDQSDRLFVGPAGQVLNAAMAKAGIDRQTVFLTNAVKRFKYVTRGKQRIHQTPTASDIKYYRWWVEQELQLVQPKLVVAMGATAAASILGKRVNISRYRGTVMPIRGNQKLLVTAHPSYVLRIPDDAGRKVEFGKLLRDLELANQFVNPQPISVNGL